MFKNIISLLKPNYRFAFAGGESFGSHLLDYDAGGDPEPGVGDHENEPEEPGKDRKPENDVSERVNGLEKQLKDSSEMIRQQSEELKELRDFKKRLLGDPDEKKKKDEELELRYRFDQDPIKTVDERMESRIRQLDEKINKTNTNLLAREAMKKIEKDYVIDWDKQGKKIAPYLDVISDDIKKKQPREAILAAMKLSGVLKKRDASAPPYIEGGDYGSTQIKEKEVDRLKKRLFGNKKTSANVFGL